MGEVNVNFYDHKNRNILFGLCLWDYYNYGKSIVKDEETSEKTHTEDKALLN